MVLWFSRPLRCWVKASNRFDHISDKLNTDGFRFIRWKKINQTASDTTFTVLINWILSNKSRRLQYIAKYGWRNLMSQRQVHGTSGDLFW